MTSIEIYEGNKIIAEFMGIIPRECMTMYINNWNNIMEVCRKWDNLKDPICDCNYYIELCDKLDDVVTLYEKEGVFLQLVKNIKAYNTEFLFRSNIYFI